MPNPLNISDAADLTDPAIQEIWLKGGQMTKQTYYEKYYNVETGVTDYTLRDSSLSGLGYASRVVENAVITSESPVQGFDKSYTQVRYAKVLSFTHQMWVFGIKKRNLERVTTELRRACEDQRERLCADRLDNSFSTSYTAQDDSGNYAITVTGGDSLALVSASHTREDSGAAWVNRVTDGTTVNMDFEYDAIKAAHRTASLILDPKGKPMNIGLDTIVVTRGLAPHMRAMEILGAINRGYIPGSADRDAASVPKFTIIDLPWITTNTSFWWMFDSSMKNSTYGLQYKESQGIDLAGPNIVFKTDEIQYKASVMFDIGFSDSRNWCGSKNTNAA